MRPPLRSLGTASGSIAPSRTASSMSSGWPASPPSTLPTAISPTSFCRSITRRSCACRATPLVRLSRSAIPTSTPFCVSKPTASSPPITPVTLDRRVLQVPPQRARCTCAGLRVIVRRHLDGRDTISRGPTCLATFDATGRPVDGAAPVVARTQRRAPAKRLDRRPRRHRPTSAHRPHFRKSGQITCQTEADRSLVNNS
jgi:hypothetical protein